MLKPETVEMLLAGLHTHEQLARRMSQSPHAAEAAQWAKEQAKIDAARADLQRLREELAGAVDDDLVKGVV